MSPTNVYSTHPSPIGELVLVSDGEALTGVVMEEARHPPRGREGWELDDGPFVEAKRQLDAYFAGERRDFDLALKMHGTPFQLRVWKALQAIPFGETVSYGELARTVGSPRGARAAGAATGRNPIPIIVPCHRVVGAGGSLVGFGGGLPRKRALLALEGLDGWR